MLTITALRIQPGMRFSKGRYASTEYRAAEGFTITILSHGFVRVSHKDDGEHAVLFGPGQWWAEGTLPEEKGGSKR